MIVLGLGSNLGRRREHLSKAVNGIADNILSETVLSAVYESDALLPEGAPEEWRKSYLNMAIGGKTSLSTENLLHAIQNMEIELGRNKEHELWSPREIDIDILAYGSAILKSEELTIPHMHILERPFAILPFADIFPEWHYPVAGNSFGKSAGELASIWRNGDNVPFNTRKTDITIKA